MLLAWLPVLETKLPCIQDQKRKMQPVYVNKFDSVLQDTTQILQFCTALGRCILFNWRFFISWWLVSLAVNLHPDSAMSHHSEWSPALCRTLRG